MDEWNAILDGAFDYIVKDGDGADDKVKAESGNGVAQGESTSPTEVKKEEGGDGAEVKDGEVKAEEDDHDGPKDVFTSTHYIGIKLREGESWPPVQSCDHSLGDIALRLFLLRNVYVS